jgi:hypothetical protein
MMMQTEDVRWVFGLPPLAQRDVLQRWLEEKQERLLVLVEEREEAFFSLHLAFGLHPQVRTLFHQGEEALKQMCWEQVLRGAEYVFSDDCSLDRRQQGEVFFTKVAHYQRGIDLLASDYGDLGVLVLRNTLANLAHACQAEVRSGISLKDQLKGLPAIICGAGPSLSMHGESLKQMGQRAAIFAGGSAIQALSSYGVNPHFLASIDPDPPYDPFFERSAFTIPFCYQNRLCERLLPLVRGEKLLFPDNGGHGWEKILLGEETIFEGGWTVATFCTAVAVHLGCDPIIFLGLDLSYSEEIYAEGVSEKSVHGGVVAVVNREEGEKKLFSKRDWILSAEWLGEFAAEHPQCTFFNAGKGLPIPGVETVCFEELCVQNAAHRLAVVQQGEILTLTKEQLQRKVEKILNGLLHIDALCDQLLLICERLHPQMPFENGKYILLEMDLEAEEVYQTICAPVWHVWQHLLPKSVPAHLNRWLFLKRLSFAYTAELRHYV